MDEVEIFGQIDSINDIILRKETIRKMEQASREIKQNFHSLLVIDKLS